MKERTESGDDADGQIERPTSADNVDKYSPCEGSDGESRREYREYVTIVFIRDAELLLDTRRDETESLCPHEVQRVSEST